MLNPPNWISNVLIGSKPPPIWNRPCDTILTASCLGLNGNWPIGDWEGRMSRTVFSKILRSIKWPHHEPAKMGMVVVGGMLVLFGGGMAGSSRILAHWRMGNLNC